MSSLSNKFMGGGSSGHAGHASGGMAAASQFGAMKKKKGMMPGKGMLAGLVGVGLLAAVLD